ncbi:MAG: hypothetical protein JO154_06605 [Chitinophaga sp.]|uniref:hypothetical protein n=1 Tax=Chitinophaga sp. TaxID=1869181 RepID=UPI0025BFBEA1|nr:hypothetical protein [Chitinophaga sp.]MBV8252263.1 hypothetical protein [Chitinophaga sp.]
MTNYQCYQPISGNRYRIKDQKTQYIVIALILFTVAIWFPTKYSGISSYITAGIAACFGLGFVNRMFNYVLINLDNKTLTQKSSLLASSQTIALSDIQSFSINNRIYGLILISSAFALVSRKGKEEPLLLGQSLMNPKNTEILLLETEKILGKR